MSSEGPNLGSRLVKLFPDQNKLGKGQIAYAALALYIFRKRALFDDFARAMANGSVSIQLHELLWVAVSQDLFAQGYVIPSRYSLSPPHRNAPATSADRNPVTDWRTLPAFCLSSRSHVVLKIASIDESSKSEEIEVYRLLTRAPYVNDTRNPIVKETRIVTLRDDEDEALVTLLVMPLLTPVCSTRFHTHASRFEFARQIIHGLAYLHDVGICHGDIHLSNLLMSNSGPPFKIYFIDFDLARREDDRTRMVAWQGGKIRLPELGEDLSHPNLYNPFTADIYSLSVTWFHFESVRFLLRSVHFGA
ncbi:hypothetical protein EXIGLDRAFT_762111 [Exidia glandulosa HHB12029]|uniref:Protein kinase domain-containing protein n=1 Tax=Exidia glandulosa HHB12029 TaxID=1314781 RepID=A0A165N062_EXIGL|nr:hypothetical protein EXIGLDRAFT_762111 [Exidia glandulosa HHB12029]